MEMIRDCLGTALNGEVLAVSMTELLSLELCLHRVELVCSPCSLVLTDYSAWMKVSADVHKCCSYALADALLTVYSSWMKVSADVHKSCSYALADEVLTVYSARR